MGTCSECIYSYTNDFFLYCSLLKNSYGGDLRVKSGGSCNHFLAKSNSSNSGYNSGSSGCFLTSACVDYLGKEDDCYELTTLRIFRDEYLKATEEGMELIKNYYEVAPSIVEKINASDKKDEYYTFIFEIVKKCIFYIENDEKENATAEYKRMVEILTRELM
ncbi:MAG: hypothetical protein IJF38_01685 [Clostridia bacterium]|nr:hypothetical protein [Clostridia bacterium]